jgi:hypothetical protein
MLILVRTNIKEVRKTNVVFSMLISFNHLNHKKINVKHMVFKRGLNLDIKVEGLGSRHYNVHVNFKLKHHVCNGLEFPKLTPIVWVTSKYCLLWQTLIIVERFNPNMQYPHMKTSHL